MNEMPREFRVESKRGRTWGIAWVRFAFALMALPTMTGCLAMRIVDSSQVKEKFTPTEILLAEDGTVAIALDVTYFRCGVFDRHRQAPVEDFAGRRYYLLLPKSTMDSRIAGLHPPARPADEGPEPVPNPIPESPEPTNVPFRFLSMPNSKSDYRLIPAEFLAEGVGAEQLPENFRSASVRRFMIGEAVPYRSGEKDYVLDFSKLYMESFRYKKTGRWVWAIPVGIVEAPIELVLFLPLSVAGAAISMVGWIVIAPFMGRP